MDTAAFSSAALYDITDKEVLYSFDACERVEPASMTKLMTAMIVLDKVKIHIFTFIGKLLKLISKKAQF